MQHTMLTREGFDVAGLEVRASNADPAPIGALWARFFEDPRFRELEGSDDDVVALYCDYAGDHTQPYTFFLGRRVAPGSELPDGLVRRQVPAGGYARFLAEGPQPAALIETWRSIWATSLDRRYQVDYEIHRSPTRVEVYVGVTPTRGASHPSR